MKLLLCADLHLRHDMPTCRKDANWLESQRYDLERIGEIAMKEDVDQIWVLGDVFHRPVETPEVVNMAISEMCCWPCTPLILCGNHDLKYHNVELKNECSIGTLLTHFPSLADDYNDSSVGAYDFGTEVNNGVDIVAIHKLVFATKNKLVQNCLTAEDMFAQYPDSRLIVMGDYHDGWEVRNEENRLAIMCGCMNIQSAALADYKPHVVIVDTETLEYYLVDINNPLAIISTEHIKNENERNERLEKCLEVASENSKTSLDFTSQLYDLATTLAGEQKRLLLELIEELNRTK